MLSYHEIKQILRPHCSTVPADDFRLRDSWAEYDEASSKAVHERPLKYLCYEIECINPETGEKLHFFKAVKFLRVIRLPKGVKQSTSLMDMHTQVLAGANENAYNLVTVIANIIRPVPLGLLFLYGVQGVADNIEDAKAKAHADYMGLIGMLQGTYRVMEIRSICAQESEWLREKMYGMEHLTVVRGIPKASKTGEDGGNKGMGGKNVNPDSHGTLEELVAGMTDHEYIVQILSTPVYTSTLKEWSLRTERDMTDWYGQLQGSKSFSLNLSVPMMFMASQSSSEGWNRAFTDADSVSYSEGETFGISEGESVGTSLSETFGRSFGRSTGSSVTDTVSNSIGQNENRSFGQSFSETFGKSAGESFGSNQSFGSSDTFSEGSSINHSEGRSVGESFGESFSQSYNISQGENFSQSHTQGRSEGGSITQSENWGETSGTTIGQTISENQSRSISDGVSTSVSNGTTTNQSVTAGISGGSTVSQSTTEGTTTGTSEGWSESENSGGSITPLGLGGSWGSSSGTNGSVNESQSSSTTDSTSTNIGWNQSATAGSGTTHSVTDGSTHSVSNTVGSSVSDSYSRNQSQSHTTGISSGKNWGTNESFSESSGRSLNESWGVNQGVNHSQNVSQNVSDGWGQNFSQSHGTNRSTGTSYGTNETQSESRGDTESFNQSTGQSYNISQGRSTGQTQTESVTDSTSYGKTDSYGQNRSRSQSESVTQGTGSSQSYSSGASGAYVTGMSSSMGMGPSIGYNKSYQWMDQQVKDILELLEYQNERIKLALRAGGAFYNYTYIACPDQDTLSKAMAVAKSTWYNETALVNPLQVLSLPEEEQRHLLYHFTAFSSDITREMVAGASEYKYCTVLLPSELVAYNHPPRISEGGVFAEVSDVPKFSVPSMLNGEIYMGTILSPERYSMQNGYRTPYDYRINEQELMHAFFTGASRSGKTVAAMRFIAELSRVRRKKTGKRLRIVCLDPKSDWRTLARFVEPERFHFHSLGNLNFRPIKINPLKIPYGVSPQYWIDGVIDVFCRAYGLLERGKQMLGEAIYALYEEAGVFDACDYPDWRERVSELSRNVTFTRVYKKMSDIKARLEDPMNPKGKAGNDTRDAYARLLDRLQAFSREFSIEHKLFGTSEGIGIDELIGADDVTVLESKGLESTFRNFLFGVICSGFYKVAISREGGYLAEGEYETVLVVEEASEILTGNDAAGTGGGKQWGMSGQSEFEQMLDQSAGYGLFIIAVTQKVSEMPKSIVANSGLIFSGRLKTADDIKVVVRAIAREDMFEDRDLVKFYPRMPTGWFICQSSRTFDIKDSEPILVQVARLNINPPTNAEIDEILSRRDALKSLS